ncbi:MAG TPA: family 16 glycoside hydrolase [Ktedonobacteraceae bacterium]|nr:family 16 glycoside hydrolase [Ktedonobacteraceae bacterium]
MLVCLIVLLAACSTGPTSPPSSAKSTSSSTGGKPTSTPTETIAPGTVLYQADWSHGLDGWKNTGGWSVVQGMLQGDSSNVNGISITAPYIPKVANYAVEARIRVVRLILKNGGFYSIFATQQPGKDGYQAGVSDLKGPGPRPNGSNAQLQIYIEPFSHTNAFHPNDNDPKTLWHTYQVNVQNGIAALYVNGIEFTSVYSTVTNNLSNGPLGINCGLVVLQVSSFRIIAL